MALWPDPTPGVILTEISCWGESRLQTGLDLSDGHGIDAGSLLLEDPEQGQVGVGLACVVDLRVHEPGERTVDVPVVLPDPRLVYNVNRGAELLGDLDGGLAADHHDPVPALEVPHHH